MTNDRFIADRAAAWRAVCDALRYARPGWHDMATRGEDAAVAAVKELGERARAFKNFHRALCERFGYVHDGKDWQRDQVSLIEWIAKRLVAETKATAPQTSNPIIVTTLAEALTVIAIREREIARVQKELHDTQVELCRVSDVARSRLQVETPAPQPDEEEETPCPKREDGIHCECWYDGKACCGCGAAAMLNGQAHPPCSAPKTSGEVPL